MSEIVYTLPPVMVSLQSYNPDSIPELYHCVRKRLDAYALEHSFGRGRKVAVIDSGIEVDHPEFEDRLLDAIDMTNSKSGPVDKIGHGTHVAGTIVGNTVGLARAAKLLSLKILDDNGTGRHDAVCAAFERAIDADVDVINVSLGSPMNSARLTELTKTCCEKGIVVVAAAGNDANTKLLYPAALEYTLAVGAIDRQDQWMAFSNYDLQTMAVDAVDYGDTIVSSYLNKTYKGLTGTSMAAPQVAACVLLRKSAEYGRSGVKRWDLASKYAMLEKACKPIGGMGRSAQCGWGLLQTDRLFGADRLPDNFIPLATGSAIQTEELLSVVRDITDGTVTVRAKGVELFRFSENQIEGQK